ncbi:hypothetical protein [Rubrobacter marinus]|uniref:hypothetical protein n=1 Tax=Rubrobacter marinus TaxID=2653852 RepID=UPI00140E2557|nr:hypothetical protein [Rubrobacter marinus]
MKAPERKKPRGVCSGGREVCPACMGFSGRTFGPECGLCRSKGSLLVLVIRPERKRP